MGKYFVLLVMCVVGMSSFAASPEAEILGTPMINQHGEVQVDESDIWRPLSEAEQKAYANPDTEVGVGEPELVFTKLDWWHGKVDEIYPKTLIYSEGEIREIDQGLKVEGEPTFLLYKLLWFVALALMTLSNGLVYLKHYNIAIALVATAAAFIFAVLFALAVSVDDNAKIHWFFSLLFYGAMAVALVV